MIQIYKTKDDLVQLIWVTGRALAPPPPQPEFLQTLSPAGVVREYGLPDRTLVHTYASTPQPPNIFRLLLFYDRGVLLAYEVPAIEEGDKLRACFETPGVAFWLWDPEQQLAPDEVAERGPNLSTEIVRRALPLKEATGLTGEEFRQLVTEAESFCLETPVDLW